MVVLYGIILFLSAIGLSVYFLLGDTNVPKGTLTYNIMGFIEVLFQLASYGLPILIIGFSASYISKNPEQFFKSLLFPVPYALIMMIGLLFSYYSQPAPRHIGEGMGFSIIFLGLAVISIILLTVIFNLIIIYSLKKKKQEK